MRLAIALLLVGCDGADDTATETAEAAAWEDTGPRMDTGLARIHFEGTATLAEGAWTGEEAWVATTVDGAVEHCRIVNALVGTPSDAELCPGCTFGFDLTLSAGAVTGDRCANVGFSAERWDGSAWRYAFAPAYVYGPEALVYTDVLLYGYGTEGGTTWRMVAAAEAAEDTLTWASLHSDLWTYYSL